MAGSDRRAPVGTQSLIQNLLFLPSLRLVFERKRQVREFGLRVSLHSLSPRLPILRVQGGGAPGYPWQRDPCGIPPPPCGQGCACWMVR